MSSKKAMKQAQKQAYAKHRSNVINTKFNYKKKDLPKINKKKKLRLILFFFQLKIFLLKRLLSKPMQALLLIYLFQHPTCQIQEPQ